MAHRLPALSAGKLLSGFGWLDVVRGSYGDPS
jgi:hypothetical protein